MISESIRSLPAGFSVALLKSKYESAESSMCFFCGGDLCGIADQVADDRPETRSDDRTASSSSSGVLLTALLLVRVDEPTRGAGADGGSDEPARDRAVTPTPLLHRTAATQDQECDEPDRSHSPVTHDATPFASSPNARRC